MTAPVLLLCLLGGLDGGVEPDVDGSLPAADAGVDFKVTPVVAPAYSPELSLFIVAGGVAAWNGSRHALRSSLAVVAGISLTGGFLSQARLTSYWMEDRVRLSAFVDVRDQPDHYFGRGFENGLHRPQGDATTSYRRLAWLVTPLLQVLMREHLFFGTVMDFTGTRARQLSLGVEGDPDFQARGGAEVTNSGLGFALTWDSRDVPVNPRRGLLLSAQWLAYGPWFAGSTRWQSLTLDYRHTVTLFREGSTLNWQLKYRTTWGDVPWTDLSQLGTPWDLRAYRWGRYRDLTAAFALVEYRFMFPFPRETLWSRLGMAAWLGVGALGETPLPDVTKPLPSVGVGLRVRVQDRVTVRFDFGVGRESYAFYFQFLEAF